MSPWVDFCVLPVIAYLAGSISFATIIARAHGVNLRTQGSGNLGATNVGRVIGRKWGYACFFLDVLKGFAPVLAAGIIIRAGEFQAVPPMDRQAAWLLTALAAIIGHMFSVFMKFRGGKGVATSLGVLLGFYPYYTFAGLCAFGLWIVAVLAWRYVSLASIIAAAAMPVFFVAFCLAFGWPIGQLTPLLGFAFAMCILVIIRHRANISRLLAGTENKIGRKKPDPPPA